MVDRDANPQTRESGPKRRAGVSFTEPGDACGPEEINLQESVPGITPSEFMGGSRGGPLAPEMMREDD